MNRERWSRGRASVPGQVRLTSSTKFFGPSFCCSLYFVKVQLTPSSWGPVFAALCICETRIFAALCFYKSSANFEFLRSYFCCTLYIVIGSESSGNNYMFSSRHIVL